MFRQAWTVIEAVMKKHVSNNRKGAQIDLLVNWAVSNIDGVLKCSSG